MTSRILSFVALAGMLVAAGCSGGGAGSGSGLSSGLTPAAPSAGGGTSSSASANGASFSLSFLVPVAAAGTASKSSSARGPEYVSPGSTGLQILLGATNATETFSVGTQAAPLQLQPTPAAGITGNVNAGSYGANSPGAFTAGTAQLSGNIPFGVTVGQTVSLNSIPGSSTITPGVGQVFTITNTDAPAAGVLSLTVKTVAGTPATGLILTATVGPTAIVNGTNSAGWTTGNLINWSAGGTSQSTYTYTFTAQTTATGGGNVNAGYYVATITFNNMIGGQNYFAAVVLTDTANNNFILSEGQTGVLAVAAQGPSVFPQLTLKPVVAGIYIPTPTPQTAAQTTADGAPVGSFETTAFLTDERGFVITNNTPVVVPDNTPIFNITSTNAGGLVTGTYGAYTQLAATTTSITTPPTTNSYAAAPSPLLISTAAAAPNIWGGSPGGIIGQLFGNFNLPTAPYTFTLGTNIVNNTGAGSPVALTCGATGTQSLKVTLSSTVPNTIAAGYTYTAGTNVPAAGPTTITAGNNSSVNCNPSIVIPIN